MKRPVDLHLIAGIPFALAFVLACEAPRDPRSSDEPTSTATVETNRGHEPGVRAIEEMRVAWPDRSKVDEAVVARLPVEARDAVAIAVVPVLMPRAIGLTEQARTVAKPAFFAVSIQGRDQHAGLSVAISATKVVHRHAGIEPVKATHSVRGGKPAWLLQNEGIWSVSWEENGVSYVVDLECARPSEDARCATAEALLSIVEDLAFVGGSFASQGGGR